MISTELVSASLLKDRASLGQLHVGDSWRVQTVNLHHLALADKDPEFRSAIETATYTTADGWPVVALLRAAGINADRVTGSDWLRDAVESGRLDHRKIALIGGSADAASAFERLLPSSSLYSETGHRDSWSAVEIAGQLIANGCELCIVAVTPPFGDIFASKLIASGYTGSVISVGGSVDMLVGIQSRAPRLAQALRLEWAWRLMRNPRRLTKRYILECLPMYLWNVLPETIQNRWQTR